jgi:heat shock protein HslJ
MLPVAHVASIARLEGVTKQARSASPPERRSLCHDICDTAVRAKVAATIPWSALMKACRMLLPLVLSACTGVSSPTATTTIPNASISASPAQTLQSYHWQLSDAVDGDSKRMDVLFGKSDKSMQLEFTGKRVSVGNACNAISGDYRIVDGHLDTKILLQTMMACMDPTLQQRETVIKATLQNKPELILSNTNGAPHMSLVAANGQTLTFTGKATAETRYAGPGETVFLEVAPRAAPCTTGTGADTSCLRVRERHYDARGLSSGSPGPWQPLQHPIEDFIPQTGVRYVLRLKRYAPKSASANKSAIYVLDTIVESGAAQPPQ